MVTVGGIVVGSGSGTSASTSGSVGAGGGDTSAGRRILVDTKALATGATGTLFLTAFLTAASSDARSSGVRQCFLCPFQ